MQKNIHQIKTFFNYFNINFQTFLLAHKNGVAPLTCVDLMIKQTKSKKNLDNFEIELAFACKHCSFNFAIKEAKIVHETLCSELTTKYTTDSIFKMLPKCYIYLANFGFVGTICIQSIIKNTLFI